MIRFLVRPLGHPAANYTRLESLAYVALFAVMVWAMLGAV